MAAFFNGLSTDHLGGAARFELGANGEVCWANPYTNVMLVRLSFVHDMRWAIDAVAESECILSNRWGDLPLWGGTIELAQSKSAHRMNMTLPLNYWHGSHNSTLTHGEWARTRMRPLAWLEVLRALLLSEMRKAH